MRSVGAPRDPATTWTIRLPYATPPLTLNGREHWATKSRMVRDLRAYVNLQARRQGIPKLGRVHVQLVYVPRDGRRRDSDNLVATLKPCLDGLVDAGIVEDDSPEYVSWDRPHIAYRDPTDPHLYITIQGVSE